MLQLPKPAAYIPYHEIGVRPHIVVDGKDQDSSLLTLSHWPWNRTPEHLRRDTSTHIVYAYLNDPKSFVDATIVSNSHYDEDGLLSMFALVNPVIAMQHADLCIATSYATDFWRCTDSAAAKLAFVLGAWSDREKSPLGQDLFELPLRQRVIAQYTHMLEALPRILNDPFSDESMWAEEYEFWQLSRASVAEGKVELEEFPELDLAIVHVPADMQCKTICRYLTRWSLPVHPFALFEHTDCSRILWCHGSRMEFQYRYESWVQVTSFRPLPRLDLTILAERLNALEKAAGQWVFEGVYEVAARLWFDGGAASSIASESLVSELKLVLETQLPAWDPYGDPPEE